MGDLWHGAYPVAKTPGDVGVQVVTGGIRAAGAPAVQFNTGTGCHLEVDMAARGLAELKPAFAPWS